MLTNYNNSVCICFSLFFFILVGEYTFSVEEIDFSTAIKIIKSKEKAIHSITFDGDAKLSDGTGASVKFTIDKEGHYRADVSNVLKTMNSDELTSRQYIRTYDGSIFREQSKVFHGKKDQERYAKGVVRNERVVSAFGNDLASGMLSYFFPYFFSLPMETPEYSFSAFLEQKKRLGYSVRIIENDDGEWLITTEFEKPAKDDDNVYVHIIYDPGLGTSGAIKKLIVNCYYNYTDAITTKECDEIIYELQQVGDFWVPKTVTFFEMGETVNDKIKSFVYQYNNIDINKSLSNEVFEIKWEERTEVVDYVTKRAFLVGDTPSGDAEAVRDFIRYHEIEPEPEIAVNNSYARVISFCAGIVLIILAIVYAIISRKKRFFCFLCLIGITVAVTNCQFVVSQERFTNNDDDRKVITVL